jgi:hypothetical protein
MFLSSLLLLLLPPELREKLGKEEKWQVVAVEFGGKEKSRVILEMKRCSFMMLPSRKVTVC